MKAPPAPPIQQVDRTYALYKNRKLSYFGGCDYFRLSSHPAVLAALRAGLEKYGLTVAASRKTTGNHWLYEKLEQRLAEFFAVPDAVLLSNGYASNLVVAQALEGGFSHALIDEKAHASLVDAAVHLGCSIIRFRHCDTEAVKRIVHRIRGRSRLVLLTDGLFSHDGHVAPVRTYLRVLPRDAVMLLDDAHGAGILGRTGKGTIEQLGVWSNRIIQTVSLSKAFGVYGGAVLGSRALGNRIRQKSRLFGGNTPPPLPLVNAALQAVQLVKSDRSLRLRLDDNVRFLRTELCRKGVTVEHTPGPMVSIVPRRAADVARLTKHLLARRVYPGFIRYPGGSENGYFRFAISSEHTRGQLENLARALVGYAEDSTCGLR